MFVYLKIVFFSMRDFHYNSEINLIKISFSIRIFLFDFKPCIKVAFSYSKFNAIQTSYPLLLEDRLLAMELAHGEHVTSDAAVAAARPEQLVGGSSGGACRGRILIDLDDHAENEGCNVARLPIAAVKEIGQRLTRQIRELLWRVQHIVETILAPPTRFHLK